MSTLYQFEMPLINGKTQAFNDFKDHVLLIVNTASKCGFTPQYEGLQKLHEKYQDKGLKVLGFPCDQFAHQEPGDDNAISEFCSLNYGVSFPMFKKIDVNGSEAAPLYEHLKTAAPGLLGSKKIKWNFTKFLISRDGNQVTRYASATKPESMMKDIEALLGE
jgi:glutathione peroxidase